jgi:putative transposase
VTKRKRVHSYEISDQLWNKIKSLLPSPKPKKKAGRPRENDKKIMNGIFYLLLTGCQWKALPKCYGAPSTVHDRFQEWWEDGLFERMWQVGLLYYDTEKGLEWEWQSIDGAMTKAPLGGAGTGANPTDRGKKGTNRSILTDVKGIPLPVVVDGANRHDKMLVKKTFDALIFERPLLDDGIQNICMIKDMIILISYNWLKNMDIRPIFEALEKKTEKYQVSEQEGGLWKGHIHG